jgi:hypothetical protein
MIIFLIFILVLLCINRNYESFKDIKTHSIHIDNLYINLSDKPFGGQKYNAILKENNPEKFILKKIDDKYYQISPENKPNLLLAINTINGIPQFNELVTFINKNNLNTNNPISRNKYRSSLWKIILNSDNNTYQIYNKRFPRKFLHNSLDKLFNTNCSVDGVVKFKSNYKYHSNWIISPLLNE